MSQFSLFHLFKSIVSLADDLRKPLIRSLCLLAFAALLQGVAFALLVPIFVALAAGNVPYLWLIALTALLLLVSVCRWFGQNFDYKGYTARLNLALQIRLGEQLCQMPQSELAAFHSGDINYKLSSNVQQALSYFGTISIMLCNAVLTPLACMLALLCFEWRFALLLAALLLLLIPFYFRRKTAVSQVVRQLADAENRLNRELIEFSQGLTELRTAQAISGKFSRIENAFRYLETFQRQTQQHSNKPELILGGTVELALLVSFAAGLMWVLGGSLPLIVLGAVMTIIVRFNEPLSGLISMFAIYQLIHESLQQITQFLAIPPLPQGTPEQLPNGADIAFERVTFQYPQSAEPAISEFSLQIPSNSLFAIVGNSGCGKSTLIRLLTHYADPTQGVIRVGGADIRHIPPKTLSRMFSLVFQEAYLLQDSIYNNLCMGETFSQEAIVAACQKANCHDFISKLPQGYQTQISELSSNLSGGEKQRIAIARALLKNAPIIILDEPTAALDVFSEQAVQQALSHLVKNKTVIVIAHRLSTIVNADWIVLLEHGRPVEQGNHQTLLALNGKYKALWGH